MQEVALNVPFEAGEIVEIAIQEFRKRLSGLSPLQGGKEYAAFSIDFCDKIRLRRAGEMSEKETLAWGNVSQGNMDAIAAPEQDPVNPSDPFAPFLAEPQKPTGETITGEVVSQFKSEEPNVERVNRDMPLTVETGDGRGGKIRKKVKVKQPKAEKPTE